MKDADVLGRLVPITSFNKGHAARIFDRARSTGPLYVLKNNVPEAVIVSPEDYARMSEAEESYRLLLEATRRLSDIEKDPVSTLEDVMAEFGIDDDTLERMPDVEFE